MERPTNSPDSSKKLVFQYRTLRDKLREEYSALLNDSICTLAELDIRDSQGRIIESGYSLIETILGMERSGKDISEQIGIIGSDKWLKLKEIWKRMREIETEDKLLTSNPE